MANLATPAFANGGLPSPGLVFAKRKRTPFRGPMLSTGVPSTRRHMEPSINPSRRGSATGKPSGEAPIQEEDEDEVEEVDYFSPVAGPGEFVTEEQFSGK